MKRFAYIAFLALLAVAPCSPAMAQSGVAGVPNTDPGFQSALFDSATINHLLLDQRTVGLRFYNALAAPGDKVGTAMAIGIRTDGSEVNSGRAYQLSLGIVNGKVTMSALKKAEAANACRNMEGSGHTSYSASFTRTEIENLFRPADCQALQAVPDTTAKGETTMRLIPVKLVDGKPEPLGPGALCSFPCPPLCGPVKNYVYRP